MEQFKSIFLLTGLTLLLIFIGGYFGGTSGMVIAFIIACGMNLYSYYYSDKLVLKHYNAVEVNRQSAPLLYDMVGRLAYQAQIPMPSLYIVPDPTPNAFATGRNPENAAVAVTEGLLDLLNEEEVEAVIAHELSHVKHYDILTSTIAATLAGAISILANMMQFGALLGGNNNRPHPIITIVLALIMPFAAMMIQMAVSRSREYLADEGAARLTGHPEWLQSALAKLQRYSEQGSLHEATEATAHMFIMNPFNGKDISFKDLFRTHPRTEDRIARLETLKEDGALS